jgi:ribokinase
MREIHVVGSCNMDLVIQVATLPDPGHTVLGGSFLQISGGKGANQAVAAKRAGGTVVLHAALGDDAYGDELLSQYVGSGIDCSSVIRVPNCPTGTAVIVVDGRGENLIAVASGANVHVSPPSPTTNVGTYLLQGEISPVAIFKTIDMASENNIPVILNNAPVLHIPERYRAGIHVLIVNEHEASIMAQSVVNGRSSAELASMVLCEHGYGVVVITLGAAGIVWSCGAETFFQPAFIVNPVDTTAAGDTFCGAFAARFVAGDSLTDAMHYASAAAALSTLTMGAQTSIPSDDAIVGYLATKPLMYG